MEFENLVKEAENVKDKEIIPEVEQKPPVVEEVKQEGGFKFEEFSRSLPPEQALGGGNGSIPPPPPPKVSKPVSIAGVKAVGRLFEKVLDEVCYAKHGMRLEDIGANINEKDLNLASELTGEAMETGELPKMPSWLTLVILVALIFAYPTYKVFAFKPYVPNQKPSPVPAMASELKLKEDVNPRTGKPYVRGKYNRKKK
jgi:hypothetical protein